MTAVKVQWRVPHLAMEVAPTRNASKNGILTANRVRFAKRPMKMKNHVYRKWPVPADRGKPERPPAQTPPDHTVDQMKQTATNRSLDTAVTDTFQ